MVLWNICICPFSTKSLGIPGIVCIYWASRFSLHYYLKNGSLLLVIICLLLITKDLIVRRFFVNASPLTIYQIGLVNRPFVLLKNMICFSATNRWDKYIIRNPFSSTSVREPMFTAFDSVLAFFRVTRSMFFPTGSPKLV